MGWTPSLTGYPYYEKNYTHLWVAAPAWLCCQPMLPTFMLVGDAVGNYHPLDCMPPCLIRR